MVLTFTAKGSGGISSHQFVSLSGSDIEKAVQPPRQEICQVLCDGIREKFRLGFDYTRGGCRQATGNMESITGKW